MIACAARVGPALSLLLLLACTPGSDTPTQPAAGSPVTAIDATAFQNLLDTHNGKVVLVNLWATWCAPCLREIPELIELGVEHGPQGFELVGVSMDTDHSNESVAAFRDKWFPAFHTYRSTETDWDELASVVDPAWDQVLPTSFIIDRDGKLATVVTGGKSYKEFAAAITPLL